MIGSGRSRWFLTASLALNLFGLGALAGGGFMYVRATQERGEASSSPSAITTESLWGLSRKLTPEHRAALQAFLRKSGDDLAEPVHRVRTVRRHAADAISAPTYDAVAVSAALTETQAGEQGLRVELSKGLVPLLAGFSADERRLLADAMLRGRVGRPSDADRP